VVDSDPEAISDYVRSIKKPKAAWVEPKFYADYLFEAGGVLLTRVPKWSAQFESSSLRRSPPLIMLANGLRKAKVAVARKLAIMRGDLVRVRYSAAGSIGQRNTLIFNKGCKHLAIVRSQAVSPIRGRTR
jgi:hypothetical protein